MSDGDFEIVDYPETPGRNRYVFTGEFRVPKKGDWFWDEAPRRPGFAGHDFVPGLDVLIPSFNWRRHIMKEITP